MTNTFWWLCFFLLIATCAANGEKKRARQMSAVEDVVYDTLFQLCKGKFNVPVKDRSTKQKASCVRFWRNKLKFSIQRVKGEEKLFFEGKAVLKKSELRNLVSKEYRHCKGIGSRKLKHRLIKRYQGVSELQVQRILSRSKLNQKLNARFGNKAIIRPIRARAVQVRNQVDLVDMQRCAVQVNGKTFKYILTMQDVLSRYLWLRPLTGKTSKEVAKELNELYCEVGPPRVLQCDNGGEFKKAVQLLCRNLEVKIIRSSAYHPQSQGKVERSHRSLHKKLMYDLLQMFKVGVNWVLQLKEYQKLLNEEPMDVLGNHSPFEVFYGRESNAVTQRIPEGFCCKESHSRKNTTCTLAKESDLVNNAKLASKLRAKAKAASRVWDERYIKRRMKNNPPSVYSVGETVLLRFPFSRTSRIAPKRRFVIEGKILERNLRLSKYKISYQAPPTMRQCSTWISVQDITSTTADKEKRKKRLARERLSKPKTKKHLSSHREAFYIPLQRDDHYEAFADQGYEVSFNPTGDGSCQFSAIAHFLQDIGIWRSNDTLRRDIVEYLSHNPNSVDGCPLELFAAMPWSEYLESMARDSTYGDQITLQAAANLYQVELVVISTLGPEAEIVISPQYSEPVAQFTLGHFSEQEGIHYVCLSSNSQDPDDIHDAGRSECDEGHLLPSNESSVEEVKFEHLPNEVLDIIINLSLTGHYRTVVDTFSSLSSANSRLSRITSQYTDRLPRVSYSRDTFAGYHSMRQIHKEFGKSSGLVFSLKEIINSTQWINAWVKLLFTGVGTWMYVRDIVWKDGKKR